MNRWQTIPAHLRYTIMDFNDQIPTDDACLEHLKEQRYPKTAGLLCVSQEVPRRAKTASRAWPSCVCLR